MRAALQSPVLLPSFGDQCSGAGGAALAAGAAMGMWNGAEEGGPVSVPSAWLLHLLAVSSCTSQEPFAGQP